ncbi:MAG: isoprenylcysteine carboxylmethyltransferase family protein [Pirellulales bacterium]
MASGTQTYIETRGFHLRGFVGGALVGCGGVVAAASAPAWSLAPAWQTLFATLGWAAFIVGGALRFWATLYVGGRKVGGRREAALTIVGPYSLCRNPLYVGSLLIGLAFALWLTSATVLLAVLLAALHYALVTVPEEEAFLRREVGAQAFDDYRRRTPRFLPNFAGYQAPAEATFLVKALRNEARRAARLLAAGMLIAVVGALRHADAWPQWFALP